MSDWAWTRLSGFYYRPVQIYDTDIDRQTDRQKTVPMIKPICYYGIQISGRRKLNVHMQYRRNSVVHTYTNAFCSRSFSQFNTSRSQAELFIPLRRNHLNYNTVYCLSLRIRTVRLVFCTGPSLKVMA
jgi:hypothetical protein